MHPIVRTDLSRKAAEPGRPRPQGTRPVRTATIRTRSASEAAAAAAVTGVAPVTVPGHRPGSPPGPPPRVTAVPTTVTLAFTSHWLSHLSLSYRFAWPPSCRSPSYPVMVPTRSWSPPVVPPRPPRLASWFTRFAPPPSRRCHRHSSVLPRREPSVPSCPSRFEPFRCSRRGSRRVPALPPGLPGADGAAVAP